MTVTRLEFILQNLVDHLRRTLIMSLNVARKFSNVGFQGCPRYQLSYPTLQYLENLFYFVGHSKGRSSDLPPAVCHRAHSYQVSRDSRTFVIVMVESADHTLPGTWHHPASSKFDMRPQGEHFIRERRHQDD
jgi:hypothetical protein